MAQGRETPCVLACPGLRGSCGRSGCVGHVHTPPGGTQQAGPSGWMSQGFKELLLPPDSLIRIRQDPQPTLCPCISCPQAFVSVSPSDAGGSSFAGPVGRWLAVCCSSWTVCGARAPAGRARGVDAAPMSACFPREREVACPHL